MTLINYIYYLPSQISRRDMVFDFNVGDFVRVYHLSARDGFLKRLIFEGYCISKNDKDFGSTFTIRTNYMGFEINQIFCTFGSNIFYIKCLNKNRFSRRQSKLYFLKKKVHNV